MSTTVCVPKMQLHPKQAKHRRLCSLLQQSRYSLVLAVPPLYKPSLGAGEMAQQLKALVAPVEDPVWFPAPTLCGLQSPVPSVHGVWHFWAPQAPTLTCAYPHTDILIYTHMCIPTQRYTIYTHVCIHTQTYPYTFRCAYTHRDIPIHTHMCISKGRQIHIYSHVHPHTQRYPYTLMCPSPHTDIPIYTLHSCVHTCVYSHTDTLIHKTK